MASSGLTVAVVGATGAVGTEMLSILEDREFPVAALRVFASNRSAGKEVRFAGKAVTVEPLAPGCFDGIDIALFSAGGLVSAEWAPQAGASGAVVIDNTSHFRMDQDIPLVVPEVNPQVLDSLPARRIIANPNCSTIQMVVALKPLHDAATLKRVVVATYQAVSGAGRSAMEELSRQVIDLYNNRGVDVVRFPHQIAFNCIPRIDVMMDDGSTREEWKMSAESSKILGAPELRLTALAVRVPVFAGHSEAVWIETEQKLTADAARELLEKYPGVELIDEPAADRYPMALTAAGTDLVYVGRIREDPTVDNGLVLWIVSDNLRKGAALNAVQIAELVRDKHFG